MSNVHESNGALPPVLLRNPTLCETHVAFSYAGNIWIANRNGTDLRRLTSAGREGSPAFSPDGEHIAFVGAYGGPRGVFVMRATGGEPRRVTHHPHDLGLEALVARGGDTLGWTPDGKRILFSSRRAAFAGGSAGVAQLFTVALEGGPAVPVPLVRAAEGSLSGDGSRISYVPHVPWQPEWKGYRGGQTTPIRIANLSDSSIEALIPRDNSNDFNPMWVGDTIYFLSDRHGAVTLFAYDLKSKRVRELVKNNGFDIKSASAGSDAIVYEQFGSLHLLDLSSGSDSVLDIRPVADFPDVRPHFKNVADIVGADSPHPNITPKLSPTGVRAVLGVHGEVLTISSERGDIRNLTRTPGVVERDPAWSPDGNSIAYFSDESGEYALHVCAQSGLGAVRKINLGDPPSFYYSPTWSPDSRKIAYTDKRLNYWYVDLEEGRPVRVDTAPFVDPSLAAEDPAVRLPVAWSPDSRWLAYIKILESHLHAVFVHSIEDGRSRQVTDGMSDVLHVAFDKTGEYMYFTASTNVGLAGDCLSMASFGRPVRRSVYALLLDKSVPMPFPSDSDDENVSKALRRQARTRVEIDLEGVAKRIVHLPIPARNYSGLFAGSPGVLFLTEAPVDQPFASRPLQVHRFDLNTRTTERVLEDVTYLELSWSGDKVLYARPRPAGKRQWLVASANNPTHASVLEFDSMEVYVEPRMEWKRLFEQVWRVQRDFMYDPWLHGLGLEDAKKRYRPFLDNIASRNDLYYLFGEMLANLNVGHMWAYPAEVMGRQGTKTGLLGADFDVEQGRYRFARIYDGDPWSPAVRSPLTEPGRSVDVGEYLLAVEGREVRPSAEVFSYFENTAGRQVVLTVGPRPDGTGSRQVMIVPLEDEYPLRYFAWIESNRRSVAELSGDRVAYVHLPDCRAAGYAAFNRYFFAQVGKQAAIIDVRYNAGGIPPDYIIECLKRPPMSYWHTREGRDVAQPSLSISGPKVMLINEMAGSAGDRLPWEFRRAGIGPSIGKRTWGGLVGIYTVAGDLLDGSYLSNPNLASYSPEGEWIAENCGVSPDIEVEEDPHAARLGRDVQLEKAIAVALELLQKSPPVSRGPRPPYRGRPGEI